MKRSTAVFSTIAAIGVGALLATGITGIANAGPGDRSPGSQSSESFTSHKGKGSGMPGMKGSREGGTPVRGEHIVQDSSGAFVTYRTILGTVTAVSSSSISVRAADSTSQTYIVNADTRIGKNRTTTPIADIAVGNTVHVMGKVSGVTATAERIHVSD